MTDRKFRRTVLVLHVFSEAEDGDANPIDTLATLRRYRGTALFVDENGRFLAAASVLEEGEVLDGPGLVRELHRQDIAADPGYFGIDEAGSDVDDVEDTR